MVGYDFYYNGKYLKDMGFIMIQPEDTDVSGLTRELLKGTVTSQRSVANHYGTMYSDVLTLPFYIFKNPCLHPLGDLQISFAELRSIQSWLTSSQTPKLLRVDFNDGHSIEYYGIFTDVQPSQIHGLNGLYLTFTCDSPYAYQRKEFRVDTSGTANYTILCDSDELEGYVYPVVTVHPRAEGDFYIENQTDGKKMQFHASPNQGDIVINSKNKRVTANGKDIGLTEIGWNIENLLDHNAVNTGISRIYWLRFLPGSNNLIFHGNGVFNVNYAVPLKVGGYAHV